MKPPLLLYIVVLAIVAVVECAECGKVSMRVVVAHMVAVSTHKLLVVIVVVAVHGYFILVSYVGC